MKNLSYRTKRQNMVNILKYLLFTVCEFTRLTKQLFVVNFGSSWKKATRIWRMLLTPTKNIVCKLFTYTMMAIFLQWMSHMLRDFKMSLSVRIKDASLLSLLLHLMINNLKLRSANTTFVGHTYHNAFQSNEDVFIKLNSRLSFFER